VVEKMGLPGVDRIFTVEEGKGLAVQADALRAKTGGTGSR
jgi:hypothetical protein